MGSLDVNIILGSALGAGAIHLVTGWSDALHAWLIGLAAHVGYDKPLPHPASKARKET
jgi:hypothetical protein